MSKLKIFSFTPIALALASMVLAAQPLFWLAQTWIEPSYGSFGAVYAIIVLALIASSVASGQAKASGSGDAVVWLIVAALIRLAGQLLAINILSATALAVDLFALARLLRLDRRPLALSPLWLAVLFLFALPFGPVLERMVGFPLQLVSADGACVLLGSIFDEVDCAGTRIVVGDVDVMVDLPCSGAGGLMLALAFVTVMNVIYRPKLTTAALAVATTIVFALFGNILRIALLAVGIVFRDDLSFDVMDEPWHSIAGLWTLMLVLLPLALYYRPKATAPADCQLGFSFLSPPIKIAGALLALPIAIAIAALEARPVDVSSSVAAPRMPDQIDGFRGEAQALSSMERAYFQRYGGVASRSRYGALGLTLVSTSSPLRHLHAPDVCLRGLGFEVRFLGTRYIGNLPSVVFEARTPEGVRFEVSVSYRSSNGEIAGSVAEAIWRWLDDPASAWTAIQRIVPSSLTPDERRRLDLAALTALDISL